MEFEKITNFLTKLEERFGVYLDSVEGFKANYQNILKIQEDASRQFGLSIDQLDDKHIIRSNFPPSADLDECSRREKHRLTQRQYKLNNKPGGLNHQIALEDCLSSIYNQWDEFKACILKKKGMPDEKIMPIMKYLNDVRDRLTHNRNYPNQGKAREILSCELKYVLWEMPSFEKEKLISLSSEDLEAVILEVKGWIQEELAVKLP